MPLRFYRVSALLPFVLAPVLWSQQGTPAQPQQQPVETPASPAQPKDQEQRPAEPVPPQASPAGQALPAPQTAIPMDQVPAVAPEPAAAKPKAPLSKAEEKEQRKRDKEAEKARKDAEAEKTYLKLQGNDIVAPTLDADGNPIKLQPCSKKDKECIKKRKALLKRKKVGMKIENGTLTVDGWTGKARLNYDISEVKFIYVSSPGLGTVIASTQQFPGSTEEKNALKAESLTVTTTDGHVIQISSDKPLVDKKPKSIFVGVDKSFTMPGKYPTLGYGSIAHAPYNWPGANPLTDKERKISAKAPPLPEGMEAKQLVLPCQKVAPGEQPKPVKINGITMIPPVCGAKLPTPNAYEAGTTPPDGSGAASTGIPEDHSVKH